MPTEPQPSLASHPASAPEAAADPNAFDLRLPENNERRTGLIFNLASGDVTATAELCLKQDDTVVLRRA